MSGDVQPRKRKDKKRKKVSEELSFEEPRGTAAALGEGDVFLHSQHEHGTGGHWCAKIIFFALLAVLVGLIGLIIMENRGLSELEANSVESRYSGVLEGWLEDAPDHDHHDEHTLDLKHHDDEDDEEHGDHEAGDLDDHEDDDEIESDAEDEVDHEDEDEDQLIDEDHYHEEDEDEDDDESLEKNDEEDDDDEDDNADDDDQNDIDNNSIENDEDENYKYDYYNGNNDAEKYDEDDQHDDQQDSNNDNEENNDKEDSAEETQNDYQYNTDDKFDDVDGYQSNENNDNEQEEEDHDDDDEAEDVPEVKLEHIEREVSDDEPVSVEAPDSPDDDGDDDDDDHEDDQVSNEADEQDNEDDEFLDNDELDNEPPVVERITAPAGKPFKEVEEDSSEQPPVDTLAEEDEYMKRQEELRREEEKASHLWLKVCVGGALLAATHAVLRRAARDGSDHEEHEAREETPLADRRMTLIPQETTPVIPKISKVETPQKKIEQEIVKTIPSIVESSPTPKQMSLSLQDEDEEVEEVQEEIEVVEDKELHSDEEIEEEEEEAEELVQVKKESKPEPNETEMDDEEEISDDVEIIEEDDLEEEIEEEEISDVDDADLLSRLEAKYGRLPEPYRLDQYNPPQPPHKDGGDSLDDEWPDEPQEYYWRQQIDTAENELREGLARAAAERTAVDALVRSMRARWVRARALDLLAEQTRDNAALDRAIAAYLQLLRAHDRLADNTLRDVALRAVDRIRFRGSYMRAEPIQKLLIRRFPREPELRNALSITYLMANNVDQAETVLKETLELWPDDSVALAHYAFVLKTQRHRLEEAVELFARALRDDTSPAAQPRFYYHWGDALLQLGRAEDAGQVHTRAARRGHFLSPHQRSLYNVPRLEARAWWRLEDTPYARLAADLRAHWREIRAEGEAAHALYEQEREGLRQSGRWTQLDLFVRGRELPACARAPVTCAVVRREPAAAGCRRGQVKFSLMAPGTRVRPHVGPTNCRLRMHLALANTEGASLRVHNETRRWREGEVLLFDDSFEHSAQHLGAAARLVLIVDVWHPQLTAEERRTLPAI